MEVKLKDIIDNNKSKCCGDNNYKIWETNTWDNKKKMNFCFECNKCKDIRWWDKLNGKISLTNIMLERGK